MNDRDAPLRHGAGQILRRALTEAEAAALSEYLDLLSSWNRVHRMVGSSDRGWLIENVVLDSLLFLSAIPRDFCSLLDIGSGAGVPGIPITIVRPDVAVVLAESRRKRASFLAEAIRTLGLTRATLFHGRAEALIDDTRRFEAVVARCAGRARSLLDLGAQLTSEGGTIVIAGPSREVDPFLGTSVRLVNPLSGAPRHFLVR